MRGYPRYNFDAFDKAAQELRSRGEQVFSPAEQDMQDGFDPEASEEDSEHFGKVILKDLDAIRQAAYVCVLPGWEKSLGCLMELGYAASIEKPVFRHHNPGDEVAFVSPRAIYQATANYYANKASEQHSTILGEAKRLVYGDRNNQYGPPFQDFARTAIRISTTFNIPVWPHEVAMIQIDLKGSRNTWMASKRDSWVDTCGYADCGWRTVQEEEKVLGGPLPRDLRQWSLWSKVVLSLSGMDHAADTVVSGGGGSNSDLPAEG